MGRSKTIETDMNTYHREYYKNNKEYHDCECGKRVVKRFLKKHKEALKHKYYILTNQQNA
jgi:hypothetical protein